MPAANLRTETESLLELTLPPGPEYVAEIATHGGHSAIVAARLRDCAPKDLPGNGDRRDGRPRQLSGDKPAKQGLRTTASLLHLRQV
jgi:hypothetical protein